MNIIGGSADDIIIANGLSNEIQGGAGEDTLTGNDGDDTFFGGAGNDQFIGGIGSDTADYTGVASEIIANVSTNAESYS